MIRKSAFKTKFFSSATAWLLLGSALLGIEGMAHAKTSAPSNAGFTALQGCMDAQNASLNVVYLMDISTSMSESDPKKVRATMLASSLQLFYQVSKESKKPLNYTFVSFGSTQDTAVTIPWSSVNAGNISQQLAKARAAASEESSYGTDWNEGLQQAQNQIKQKQNIDQNACFVLSWMTDGQIDLNPKKGATSFVPANRSAYKNICKESGGLINWFRNPANNIATLGALLSQNANLNSEAFNSLKMEQKSVSLFKPVIEGSGDIPKDVATKYDISSGNYDCGLVTDSSHLGTLVSSGQAEDLAWQFLDLVAHLRNLNQAQFQQIGKNYQLQIDNSVGRLEVFTKGKGSGKTLTVKDASGTDICITPGQCRRTENSDWTEWVVDIPGDGISPGSWAIRIDSGTPAKIFLGSQGDPKKLKFDYEPLPVLTDIIEGTTVETNAKLVHEDGTAVAANEFKNVCVELTKPVAADEPECIDGTVSIPIKFNAETSYDALQVTAKYTFSASQEQGQVTDVQPMRVKSNNLFAKLSCATTETDENGSEVCRLNPIRNSHKKSATELVATVGRGQSTLEITGFKVQDSKDRVDSYSTAGTPVNEDITVIAGNPKSIQFVLANSKIKTPVDNVNGIITYSVKDSTGQEVTSQLKVVFDIQAKRNWLVVIVFYLLALLVGLGIPYVLLIFAAKSAGTFVATSFRYMTFPIQISNEGVIRAKNLSQNEEDETEGDFNGESNEPSFVLPDPRALSVYTDVPKGSKQVQIDNATLIIVQKTFDPFSPIKVELTSPGSLVYTNRGDSIAIETGHAEQSLVGLYFVTASLDELEPVADESPVERAFDFDDTSFDAFGSSEITVRQDGLDGQITLVVVGEVNPRTQLQRFVEDLQTSEETFKKVIEDLQKLRKDFLEKRKIEAQASKSTPIEDVNQIDSWSNQPSFEGENDIPQPNFE